MNEKIKQALELLESMKEEIHEDWYLDLMIAIGKLEVLEDEDLEVLNARQI